VPYNDVREETSQGWHNNYPKELEGKYMEHSRFEQ
jgi:hypothetical protein